MRLTLSRKSMDVVIVNVLLALFFLVGFDPRPPAELLDVFPETDLLERWQQMTVRHKAWLVWYGQLCPLREAECEVYAAQCEVMNQVYGLLINARRAPSTARDALDSARRLLGPDFLLGRLPPCVPVGSCFREYEE